MRKKIQDLSWVGITTILTFVVILPICLIVIYALSADGEVLAHIKETVLFEYIKNTIILLVYVCALSLLFGVGSAFFLTFYKIKFEKIIVIGLMLPFAIPTYILGFIYSDLLGYYSYFHLFLISLGIKNYIDILNIHSVSIILALALYPYVFMIVRASFKKNSSTIINPALSLGLSQSRALFKLVLPLNRVAIVAGLSLVMMETISEYGVVSYYGINTLSTAIFSTWFGMGDSGSAAYISSIAMIFILSVLVLEKYSQGKAKYTLESTQKPIRKIELKGIKKVGAYLFLSFPLLFGFLIPIVWIIYYSAINFHKMLEKEFLHVITNSLFAGVLSSVVIVVISLVIAYTFRIIPNTYTKYLTRVATLGYSMPGAVVAIGIIILFGDFDNYLIEHFSLAELLLSGTIFALCFGYVARFLAVGLNAIGSAFSKIGTNINKASRNLGKSPLKTLLHVEIPLLKGYIFIAFLMVLIDVLKELPLTLILRPFNYETLATKVYELAINEMVQESSIYALFIVLLSFIPILMSTKVYK